jgi:hypothetical protein
MFLVIGSVLVQSTVNVYLTNRNVESIYISFTSGCVGVILVLVLHAIYFPVAVLLNNRENYQKNTDHDDNLIVKLWVFNFVNIFALLFY